MYCTKCGQQNDDNASVCIKCHEPLASGGVAGGGGGAPTANIPNYLVQSILVTLFCCLPLGVAAIVYAAQVNGKVASGDIAGAHESSAKAKKFCWWAVGAGVIINLVGMAIGILGGMSSNM